MRVVRVHAVILVLLTVLGAQAQPGSPDIGFTLVIDDRGRPMPGIHAQDVITRHDLTRAGKPSWSVQEHFTNRSPYEPARNGEHTWWMLHGIRLPGLGRERLRFHFIDCWCTEHYIRVQNGDESMRIDLPDAPADRWAIAKHVMARSGYRASPEVIRFRPGRYTFTELMTDPAFDRLEQRIAKRLKGDENASYVKELKALEERYREQPPSMPPQPASPPVSAKDQVEQGAQQPPLKSVQVVRVNADTVCVKLSGRVMLDGGCASSKPLFGIERRTDSGWVECIPFDMTQMDCGMPWADWEERVVMLPPLRWWIGTHQPAGSKELRTGSYRLFFVGGDLKRRWSGAFVVE